MLGEVSEKLVNDLNAEKTPIELIQAKATLEKHQMNIFFKSWASGEAIGDIYTQNKNLKAIVRTIESENVEMKSENVLMKSVIEDMKSVIEDMKYENVEMKSENVFMKSVIEDMKSAISRLESSQKDQVAKESEKK